MTIFILVWFLAKSKYIKGGLHETLHTSIHTSHVISAFITFRGTFPARHGGAQELCAVSMEKR